MKPSKLVYPSEIEHETGLSKDLLRKWRERYNFPIPAAGEAGRVGYSREQVQQLRLIKRLQDAGYRPVQVVGRPLAELERLVAALSRAGDLHPGWSEATGEAIALVKANDLPGLKRLLRGERRRRSLGGFVIDTVAPLVDALGEAWAGNEIVVYQEHLCSMLLVQVLLAEIGKARAAADFPTVALATPSDELHQLGILMAHAVLADGGARCIGLGTQVPVDQLELAVSALGADILALSFSQAYPQRRVQPLLARLRSSLPGTVEIWAGGAGAAAIRRPPPGVRVFRDLASARQALQADLR